jgi:hypothetical protein
VTLIVILQVDADDANAFRQQSALENTAEKAGSSRD